MPLGWRDCKVINSSSGVLIHHQPRTIAGGGKEKEAKLNTLNKWKKKPKTQEEYVTPENSEGHRKLHAYLWNSNNFWGKTDTFQYLHAGIGLTTSCVKYCCSSSWKTEFGGRPRRFAAAPRGPLRAGLLPLLPLLRLRAGLAGVAGVDGAGGLGVGRSWGFVGGELAGTAQPGPVGGMSCSAGGAGTTGSAGGRQGKSGSG